MSKIIIKNGSMNIADIDRINLINCEQTHDGIVFTFKHGITIYCTDNYMPLHTKNIIVNSTINFPKADLIINLSDYNKPVLVEKN